VFVWSAASGTEIHRVSITGPGHGVVISGAEQVLLEQVWIHDNENMGIQAHNMVGPPSVTIRDSLFEDNTGQAVFAAACALTVEDTVLRDTLQAPSGFNSAGLTLDCTVDGDSSTVSMHHCLVEQNISVGVFASCADLSVTDSVIRDQVVDPNGHGEGIAVDSASGANRSTLTLRSSALLDNHNIGVFLRGAAGTVENTVVRGTRPRSDSGGGHGINIQDGEQSGRRSELSVRTSVLEDNTNKGLALLGADVEMDDSVIRDTLPGKGGFGLGAHIERRSSNDERSSATVRRSVVEGSWAIGMYVTGGDLSVDASIIRDTVDSDYTSGGFHAGADPEDPGRTTLTVARSSIEHNAGMGVIAWGADVTLIESVVQDSQPGASGHFGHGMAIYDSGPSEAGATLTVLGTLFERNQHHGILMIGRDALLDGVVVRDTLIGPSGIAGLGIAILDGDESGSPATASLRSTSVERSRGIGIYASGVDISIEASAVTDTEATDTGLYGDGICLDSPAGYPTTATITDTAVSQSARAGVLNVGSHAIVSRSLFLCQAFDMDGENGDTPFQFDDRGGNGCGCPAAVAPCQVLSASLQPPSVEAPPGQSEKPPSEQ
jgi:hypothetical protein